MTTTPGPVAVPNTPAPEPVAPQQTVVTPTSDPALDGFYKAAAERRERIDAPPVEIPFGSQTIRIYGKAPALFIADLVEATVDPSKAISSMRCVIIDEDKPKFESILKLNPDNPDGIDGDYLMDFIKNLATFYGAVPLDA